jgi:hypothetical protein
MKPFTCSRPTAISRCFAAIGVAVVAFALLENANSAPRTISPRGTERASDPQISAPANPANARAVFRAQVGSSSDPVELWSTPIAGGSAVNLSGSLVPGGEVSSFVLSKDGTRAVFLANKDDAAKKELYSVPVDGSTAPVKRSGTLEPGGNVLEYAISDNSQRIVYIADKDFDGRDELYSVPIAVGSGMKIVDVAAATRDVESFLISPDSTRVVFRADLDTNDIQELYSVGIASTTVTKISQDLTAGNIVFGGYAITPDSSRVVYLAEIGALKTKRLLSVPITGGTSRNHSTEVPAGEAVSGFAISPNGSQIIFRAPAITNGPDALYSVPISGTNTLVISRSASLYGEVQEFLISPDSTRVIYRARGSASAPQQFHSVPVNSNLGGTTVCPQLVPGDSIQESRASISPDSNRVLFSALIAATTERVLFSASIAGGNCVALWGLAKPNLYVRPFRVIDGSGATRVVFFASTDFGSFSVDELFSVPLAGGMATKIFSDANRFSSIEDIEISTDSKWIVFSVRENQSNTAIELFSVASDGGGPLLDIDGDGKVLSTTDMLLVLRYQLGIRGNQLIANTLGVGATRNTASAVEQHLRNVFESPSP